MATNLKSRVEALEQAAGAGSFRVVLLRPGETHEDALRREGLPPDFNGLSVFLMRFSPMTEAAQKRGLIA